jgi:hypothetical protein
MSANSHSTANRSGRVVVTRYGLGGRAPGRHNGVRMFRSAVIHHLADGCYSSIGTKC